MYREGFFTMSYRNYNHTDKRHIFEFFFLKISFSQPLSWKVENGITHILQWIIIFLDLSTLKKILFQAHFIAKNPVCDSSGNNNFEHTQVRSHFERRELNLYFSLWFFSFSMVHIFSLLDILLFKKEKREEVCCQCYSTSNVQDWRTRLDLLVEAKVVGSTLLTQIPVTMPIVLSHTTFSYVYIWMYRGVCKNTHSKNRCRNTLVHNHVLENEEIWRRGSNAKFILFLFF